MHDTEKQPQRSPEQAEQPKPKRPYVSPQVEDVGVLTNLALGSPVEGGGGFRDRIF